MKNDRTRIKAEITSRFDRDILNRCPDVTDYDIEMQADEMGLDWAKTEDFQEAASAIVSKLTPSY